MISDCLGFCLIRTTDGGKAAAIDSWAGFEDEHWSRGDHKPSTVWPIQKFWWTDFSPLPGQTVRYRAVPMGRTPDGLKPQEDLASGWTDPILITHDMGNGFSCYFNRGIVATQFVQRLLGAEDTVSNRQKRLDTVIKDLEHPAIRNVLSGELRVGLLAVLDRAKADNAKVRGALFELLDEELLGRLTALGGRLELVLADGAPKETDLCPQRDPEAPPVLDENCDARKALRESGAVVHDRMCHAKFLGHNKFLVITGEGGAPQFTWTGSTNFTDTGLCTQVNNGLLVDDGKLAQRFWDHVDVLARAGSDSPDTLARANSETPNMTVGPVGVRAWFTRTKNEVDLEEARRAIATAAHGALFLFFQIGLENSLLSALLARREDPGFFLHGVISSQPQAPPASGEGRGVHHRKTHEEVIAGQLGFVHKNEPIQYAPDLVLPFAREKATEQWLAEFVKKNGAHAIVHSKVIVLDPFGDEPVVMTGSHNMGRTASGTNDENMVIVTGHAGLAAAYTAHIMSVYDNFRWRYRVAAGSKWKGSSRDPNWQRRYLDGKVPEFAFFTPTSD